MKSSFPALSARIGYWNLSYPLELLIALCCFLYVIACLGYFLIARRRASHGEGIASIPNQQAIALIFALCIVFHYLATTLFGKWQIDVWYFAGYPIAMLLILGLSESSLVARLGQGNRANLLPKYFAVAITLFLILGLVYNAAIWQRRNSGIRGHRGAIYQSALWVARNVPADAVFGMRDAGTFGYFGGHRTVNLDGVINNYEYQDFLGDGRFADYVKAKNVSYIVNFVSDARAVSNQDYCLAYDVTSHLYDKPGGSITLCKKDEVYRLPYSVGNDAWVVLVWKLPQNP